MEIDQIQVYGERSVPVDYKQPDVDGPPVGILLWEGRPGEPAPVLVAGFGLYIRYLVGDQVVLQESISWDLSSRVGDSQAIDRPGFSIEIDGGTIR